MSSPTMPGDGLADAFFKTLSGANRYALLFCIQTAQKPEARARRIQLVAHPSNTNPSEGWPSAARSGRYAQGRR